MGNSVRPWLPAGPIGLALLASGCGTSSQSPPAIGTAAMLHPTVVQNRKGSNPDAFYVPNPIRIRVGQTVTWTNNDNDLHDVTAVDGSFASYSIPYRGTWRMRFTRAGTYPYFCTLHPEMHGTIIVVGPS